MDRRAKRKELDHLTRADADHHAEQATARVGRHMDFEVMEVLGD